METENEHNGETPQTAPELISQITKEDITYITYTSEAQLKNISTLMEKDLSEPYSVFTYRYFINNWPELCWMAIKNGETVGAIVCKLETKKQKRQGYIAMLAVDKSCRKCGIGSELVIQAVNQMSRLGCDEVMLETEVTNKGALALYENLGFVRDKRLYRYYLNGGDAYRLKALLIHPSD